MRPRARVACLSRLLARARVACPSRSLARARVACLSRSLARACVACLSCLLACGGDDKTHDDASSPTAASSATVATTAGATQPLVTTGESTSESTSEPTGGGAATTADLDATADATADGSTSTGLITTFFTTGDNDVTGFDTGAPCEQTLTATIRDFRVDHPDFEDFTGDTAYKGLVLQDLGADKNPVHAAPGGTPQTTGPAQFAEWYSDVPNVNIPLKIELQLTEASPGLYSYASNAFFPIDDFGWGNEGNAHNFHFTTEIHTTFPYEGGEQFTFTGDDDLWLFINDRLALDLGGTHPQLSETIDLDALAPALGISPGNSYTMDIFHAERHTDESNFRIDTSIGCFYIPE